MKLVNIHKLYLLPIIFFGVNMLQAQQVWTLKQCIDSAQLHNKNLKINRNNIEISKQQQKEIKAALNPKITALADYSYFLELPTQLMPTSALNPESPEGQFRDIQFGVPHKLNANIQLSMPLYNPQINGAIQNSKIGNELSELQYQKTEEQLLYDITILYFNAQILKHQLDFIDTNILNTEKLLNNIQLLRDHQMAIGTDVNKVKLQSDQLYTQKENVKYKYNQILNALKLNMGISVESNLTVETDISFRIESEQETETILDIKIIQAQNKLLATELNTLNKSRYLPYLNLVASYGFNGFGYDRSPNQFLDFYPVSFAGIQLSYPIFDGRVTQKKIEQKKLEIRNNELREQLIKEQNKVDIENISDQKEIALQSITDTENQISLAQSIYDQSLLQQKQGTASLTDVLLADNSLREAQQNYLNSVIDYLKSEMELKKLKGRIRE